MANRSFKVTQPAVDHNNHDDHIAKNNHQSASLQISSFLTSLLRLALTPAVGHWTTLRVRGSSSPIYSIVGWLKMCRDWHASYSQHACREKGAKATGLHHEASPMPITVSSTLAVKNTQVTWLGLASDLARMSLRYSDFCCLLEDYWSHPGTVAVPWTLRITVALAPFSQTSSLNDGSL